MKQHARIYYHATLWPAVCRAQGCRKADQDKRRAFCLFAMQEVGGPLITTSEDGWTDAETTALFAYLHHIAEPHNLTLELRWDQCKQDYKAFHLSKIADWYEKKAYGAKGSGKLYRTRFDKRRHAMGFATEETLTEKQAAQRRMTMRDRYRAKDRKGNAADSIPAENLPF